MTKNQSRYQHERQTLLPLNEAAKEQNRRNRLRETQLPVQLELLRRPQQDLFG
jgi:hypothetical protein